MIPPGGIDASVWGGLIGTGVAFVLACVLTSSPACRAPAPHRAP